MWDTLDEESVFQVFVVINLDFMSVEVGRVFFRLSMVKQTAADVWQSFFIFWEIIPTLLIDFNAGA